MPEFQGGSYNPWGGPQGGCPADIGVDFANLMYRNLIYQKVTAISLYMIFGGTNWGHTACPVVATSYDYSSPVSENRIIGSKYYETKLLSLFTRAAHDLAHTVRLGNNTDYTTNDVITVAELRNPDTNGAFYVIMHDDTTSGTTETFKLHVNTSEGELTIPQFAEDITIDGHQAKILVTDFTFGNKKLLYSTAEVLSFAVIDGKSVLALWLPEGESGEFSVKGASSAESFSDDGSSVDSKDSIEFKKSDEGLVVSYVQSAGTSIVQLSDGTRILLLDREAAYRFWAPTLNNDPFAPVNETGTSTQVQLVESM